MCIRDRVNRGNDFFRGNGALCRIAADVIAFANDLTAFDAAASEVHGPAVWPVIATPCWVDFGRATKFSKAGDHGVIQHATLMQVLNEGAVALVIHRRDDVAHPFDAGEGLAAMDIPSDLAKHGDEGIHGDEAHSSLDEAALNWGVKVLRYEIKDLTPPNEILRSMQAQITAEREKRARIAESEGRKQEQINIATGERESQIQRSEGQRQAEVNRALGEASAISTVADATAQAIERIAASIRQPGGIEAVNLKVAERYVDAFAGLAKTNNTMIVPANLSDLATLIASAAQVVKAQTTTVQGPRVG